jgi:tRNA-dihydrouridine synthase
VHFRLRRNVVQLVRTSYNAFTKKPKAVVVGRMSLRDPELSPELKRQLTEAEIAEAEAWIEVQHRMNSLKEEFAALTLPETLALASRWFSRNADSPAAAAVIPHLLPELQALHKMLRKKGLFG